MGEILLLVYFLPVEHVALHSGSLGNVPHGVKIQQNLCDLVQSYVYFHPNFLCLILVHSLFLLSLFVICCILSV